MLDDQEFQQVISRRSRAAGLREQFIPVLDEYERITGFRETNPNAIYHHVLSEYGDPCRSCGKPLRSPRAKICGSCMTQISENEA